MSNRRRMAFARIVSIVLQLFVLIGSPLYVNFYATESSIAFLSMSRILYGMFCFVPVFLLAQTIVWLVDHSASFGGKNVLASFDRVVVWSGLLYYAGVIVFCAVVNVVDLYNFGACAYKHFPVSLGLAIYFSSALEVLKLSSSLGFCLHKRRCSVGGLVS